MFFQGINNMMGEGDTLVVMVNKGGNGMLSLTITPKGTFKNANLGVGLNVEATPEELDSDLETSLRRYTLARKTLLDQVEAASVVLESAAKEVTADTVQKMGGKVPGLARAGAPSTEGKSAKNEQGSPSRAGDDEEEDGDGGVGGVKLF